MTNPAAGGERSPTRMLFVIGTAHYDSPEYADRQRIPAVLDGVVRTFEPFQFRVRFTPPGYLLDPDRTRLQAAIRQARSAAEFVVIYYTGHGDQIEHEGYHLITTDFAKAQLPDAGVKVVDLPFRVAKRVASGRVDPQQPPTLIILDCCFSGTGALDVLRDALLTAQHANPAYANLWVWATAGNTQWADAGLFARALAEALNNPTVGASTSEIPLQTLLDKVNTTLAGSGADQLSELVPPYGRMTHSPPFFANPGHLPDVAGLTVDEQHWISKARGAPDASATGFYLTGRTGRMRAATDLARWIADAGRSDLAIVTGGPGTGKSTLLALPALLTDQEHRDTLLRGTPAGSLTHAAAALLPVATALVAVHARGLNIDQVAVRIATGLDRPATTAAALLDSLRTEPLRHGPVILVDALDEATEPVRVREHLLLPLSRTGPRVVVGARKHVLHVLSAPDTTDTLIDLGAEIYRDPEALTDYVRQLLLAVHEPGAPTPYRDPAGLPHPDTDTVASAIAARATSGVVESFLIARVIALALRSRPARVDVTTEGWTQGLPAGLEDAFEEDLGRLGNRTRRTRILLEALAWARGEGLPWESPVAQPRGPRRRRDRVAPRVADHQPPCRGPRGPTCAPSWPQWTCPQSTPQPTPSARSPANPTKTSNSS